MDRFDFEAINQAYSTFKDEYNEENYRKLLTISLDNLWAYFRNQRIGYSKLSDDDAYDLAMEVMTYMYEFILSGDSKVEDFASYWYRAAENRFRKYISTVNERCIEYIGNLETLEHHLSKNHEEKDVRIADYLGEYFKSVFQKALSASESEVMNLILQGKSNVEISGELAITGNYVATIKDRAMQKLRIYFKENNIRPENLL